MIDEKKLKIIEDQLTGSILYDDLHKALYATDASVYRKIPLAVAYPKNTKDLQLLIEFAKSNKISLIPRTAGTSLAGQCVGEGIIVDVSKHFTNIIAFDEINKTITVEPGVIRDELNLFLKPFGLFFGPNTSTSNRCMIGGMVGNNSSGSTSIKYGVTRDKVLQIDGILSDGSLASFKELSSEEFIAKTKVKSLEGEIYSTIFSELSLALNDGLRCFLWTHLQHRNAACKNVPWTLRGHNIGLGDFVVQIISQKVAEFLHFGEVLLSHLTVTTLKRIKECLVCLFHLSGHRVHLQQVHINPC